MRRQRVRLDASPLEATLELVGEQQVQQFRAEVGRPASVTALLIEKVAEVDLPSAVPQAAHVHDPRPRCGEERVEQPARQGEVAQVVGAHLALEAVLGLRVRPAHDPGVVRQHIKAGVVLPELRGEALHGGEAGQVEQHQLGLRAGNLRPYFLQRALASLWRAAGEDCLRALARELPRPPRARCRCSSQSRPPPSRLGRGMSSAVHFSRLGIASTCGAGSAGAGDEGSNSRHPAWKAGALPLSYSRSRPWRL